VLSPHHRPGSQPRGPATERALPVPEEANEEAPASGRGEPRTYRVYPSPECDEEGSGALDLRERSVYADPHPRCLTQKHFPELNGQGYLEWVSHR